jgi:hypothetical protein
MCDNRKKFEKYLYAVDNDRNKLEFNTEWLNDSVKLTLPVDAFKNAESVRLLPELSAAEAGDEGYYIIPRKISIGGDILTKFKEREDVTYTLKKPILSAYGIKKADFTVYIRIERNYKYGFETVVNEGKYTLCPLFDFTQNDKPYDDIRLEIFFLPENAAYADMARIERNLRLQRNEITTLAEKCEREAVEYARKYPLIRIRMGWKPSPSRVFHQTLETEPDMFVACDFKRVRDIADELKAQGVPGAELQLVGWNIAGHDGRFPQLFPADPRFGGDKGLRETIDYVKSLGYRISLHTNLIDAVEVANTFTWDDVAVRRDGKYNQTGHYSGGYAYHVCLKKQYKNFCRDYGEVAALGLNGLHFTDVISIVEPDDCHSKKHPCTTGEGIAIAKQIIKESREMFGGFSSEGCFDFALTDMDYGLYVCFGDGFGHNEVPICDVELPFFELCYHGIVLYNPTSPTVNFPIKQKEDQLIFFMRGGRPSYYFYSKFRTGGAKNWMGENDFTANGEDDLRECVSYIKRGCEEYAPLAERQLIYMTDYEVKNNGIHVATYEDGVRMIGNFSDAEAAYEGDVIEPYGYIMK